MNFFDALILAIVEGITEFLPISSTGHLILTARLIDLTQTDFVKSFEIIIQLGAILAIVTLYWQKLISQKKAIEKLIVAFVPTAIVGFIFYNFVKSYLLGNTLVTLVALFIVGVILIVLELFYLSKHQFSSNEIDQHYLTNLSLKKAFMIGIFQSISIIPGVSRSAATIMGSLFLGLSRKQAVEFSFLLAIPTIAGAVSLDLIQAGFRFNKEELSLLLIGFTGSFVVALITVKLFISYIQKNNFLIFGIYRVILTVIYWFLIVK